ncbi:acetate/propionate family kinase [Marinagarivorans cellulosilyticus]|uniref:Acetate kinase n=1 Tax=Marinagarivorans cellulosilyticus TaxID=2721545 RepID=A0AAN2BLS9_9GAMM|nr:acetate/propionate family kinase [Marinagarivorans cellulosilyticus]BCD99362.1 acetate kinase [Marinagarivorans cellulosilyticus]
MTTNDIVLSINSGSSSIKFSAFTGPSATECIAKGQVSSLDSKPQIELYFFNDARQYGPLKVNNCVLTSAIEQFCSALKLSLQTYNHSGHVSVVSHRVVHGGDIAQHRVIDDALLCELTSLVPLDPLHLPSNIAAIKIALDLFPHARHVACFDTVFHTTIPLTAKQYALPKLLFDQGIKRYGFHGLSYQYVCQQLKAHYNELNDRKLIVAHLGSGASLCAIKNGDSQYCTMGFSVLDGVTMGTRCGAIDPGVLLYLLRQDYSALDIEELLYRQSGLLGLSGLSNDMRNLFADDSAASQEAIAHFTLTVVREIGALTAMLNGCNTLVFTGGIGEHAPRIRARVCQQLSYLGLELDDQKNNQHCHDGVISGIHSKVEVWVISTNEEKVMAQIAQQLAANNA